MRTTHPCLLAASLLASACSSAAPAYPPFFAPPPAYFQPPPSPLPPPPAAVAPPAAPRAPENVAVLPLEDDGLFRAERAELRAALAGELARRAPGYAMLPLAEVDAKLRPASSTGARCAFEGEPLARRASQAGWLSTDILHVAGVEHSPEELWVTIGGRGAPAEATLTALWDPKLDLVTRYRTAFASLRGGVEGGLIGGLSASGDLSRAARSGPVRLCEEKPFGDCEARSSAWSDRLSQIEACYPGEDEGDDEVLVQGGAAARCELVDVDDLAGPAGAREACLCKALLGSAGLSAKSGRRVLRVRFEAPDLAGKPRPRLRAVEASTNLHAESDWETTSAEVAGKKVYSSAQRLVVDNVDALAAPLARCGASPEAVIVAALDIAPNGAVTAARVLAGAGKKQATECLQRALGRGAFTCTNDGKPASVVVAARWPAAAH